jgi:hypothetical protein
MLSICGNVHQFVVPVILRRGRDPITTNMKQHSCTCRILFIQLALSDHWLRLVLQQKVALKSV